MKIKIYKNPLKSTLDILIYDESDGRKYVTKPVNLELKEWKEGEEIKPTLSIPTFFLEDDFLKELAEELDRINVKTDKDAKIEGLLEATRYHLEDLRKLLKLHKN